MQVGTPDAVLTIDLGAERTIRSFSIDWRFPARSVLVLYSPTAAGNDWQNGTNVQMADTPPTTMVLEARARRIRFLHNFGSSLGNRTQITQHIPKQAKIKPVLHERSHIS